jgi:hypothetical protein
MRAKGGKPSLASVPYIFTTSGLHAPSHVKQEVTYVFVDISATPQSNVLK